MRKVNTFISFWNILVYYFQVWLPDVEVLNLKIFHALDVLDKLQGLWVNQNSEILYVLATRITFICAMSFEAFPLDIQTCLFQVSINLNYFQELTLYKISSWTSKFFIFLKKLVNQSEHSITD